jgi:ABC-type multidrug transport system fused ATPase/permease subunit
MQVFLRITGKGILSLLALSVLLGTMLGLIELVFAFALNFFLASYGLMQTTPLPRWLATVPLSPVSLVLTALVLRFAFVMSSIAVANLSNEVTNRRMRMLIVHWTLDSDIEAASLSASEAAHFVSNLLPKFALYLSSASQFCNQIVVATILLASMISLSAQLSGLALLGLGAVGLPTFWLRKSYQSYSTNYHKQSGIFVDRLLKVVRNLYFIRLTGMHFEESGTLEKNIRRMSSDAMHYVLRSQLASSIPAFGGALIFVALVVWNRHNALGEASTFLSFLYLFYRFSAALGAMVLTYGQIEFAKPFVMQTLDFSSRFLVAAPRRPRGSAALADDQHLEVSSLSVGRDFRILDGITFTAAPGEIVFIAGASGRGKTTLLMTLLGVVPRLGGTISWGGIPIDEIDIESFRQAIGYSGADPYLVDGSLRDNLLYGVGNRAPSDSEIRLALDFAQCQFVEALEGGLSFRLHEGGQGLSAGEKQRLSIARALLKRPRIIVLDEATSNIDEATEYSIIKAIRAKFPAAPILLVSHRQSLRAHADKVIEL